MLLCQVHIYGCFAWVYVTSTVSVQFKPLTVVNRKCVPCHMACQIHVFFFLPKYLAPHNFLRLCLSVLYKDLPMVYSLLRNVNTLFIAPFFSSNLCNVVISSPPHFPRSVVCMLFALDETNNLGIHDQKQYTNIFLTSDRSTNTSSDMPLAWQ